MAKPLRRKAAHKMLKKASCAKLRDSDHEIFKRPDGDKFSLPYGGIISAGVVRKLEKFCKGLADYSR